MLKQSLGLIETIGLSTAVAAADAAVKSANITLRDYQLTNGDGMVLVSFEGEVGAVNAAVAAGCVAAEKVGRVFSFRVIARCAENLDSILAPEPETVTAEISTEQAPAAEPQDSPLSAEAVPTAEATEPEQNSERESAQGKAAGSTPAAQPSDTAEKKTTSRRSNRNRRNS